MIVICQCGEAGASAGARAEVEEESAMQFIDMEQDVTS